MPPKSSEPSLADALQAARAVWKLSRAELAEAAGISPRSVLRWESLATFPRSREKDLLMRYARTREPATAARLAIALGLPPPPLPSKPPPPPELVVAPIEAALFRQAERAGVAPATLRQVLVRFLEQMDALGISPAEARRALGEG